MVLFLSVMFHLVGDYVTQSSYMANNKTARWLPAIAHGIVYTLPFLFLTRNVIALSIIAGTHILIDHYRWAKQISWFKNLFAPGPHPKFKDVADNNGYGPETPVWLSTWLMIITDNILHIAINTAALWYASALW